VQEGPDKIGPASPILFRLLLQDFGHNGGKQSQEQLAPHMVTVHGDEFVESYAYRWLQATDRDGSYNDVAFADINGDGACDFLAAIEAEKEGGESAKYTTITTNDRIAPCVVFNKNGSFSGERVDLPNPYFGENTAAFYITTVRFGAERLVALTTAEFRGHHIGFRKFVFQLYAYRDGKFVEVTKDLVSGKIDTDEANQAQIQVLDLDSDGDDDIYFGRYARAIQVYLNDGRRFVRKEIAVSLPKGQKAVAFLRTQLQSAQSWLCCTYQHGSIGLAARSARCLVPASGGGG
jgi:hypothetical protein